MQMQQIGPPSVPLTNIALAYHRLGANVLAIHCNRETGEPLKGPEYKWANWQLQRQSVEDVQKLFAPEHVGVGIIAGFGNWRCFDVDGMVSPEIVKHLLIDMGLAEDYAWVVYSGSGVGAHIWFRCEEEIPPEVFDNARHTVMRGDSRDGSFHHLELRWSHCQTLLPPSLHKTGKVYSFATGEEIPQEAPALVPVPKVIAAFINNTVQKRADQSKQTPEETFSAASIAVVSDRYVQAVVRGVLDDLSSAQEGFRNTALFRAAFKIGQLLPVSSLSRWEVENVLADRARSIGLTSREIVKTIQSGLKTGIANPKKPGTTRSLGVSLVSVESTMPKRKEALPQPEAANYELEIIAHILAYPEKLYIIAGMLQPEMFTSEATRHCYIALRQLMAAGGSITRLAFEQQLKDGNVFDLLSALLEKITALPTVATYEIEYAATVVIKAYKARLTLQKTAVMCQQIQEVRADIDTVIQEMAIALGEIGSLGKKQGIYTPREFVDISMRETLLIHDRICEGYPYGLQTQFIDLNNLTGGFGNGETILIAGKTSSGKTAFTLQLLEFFALNQKIPFGFVSLEMAAPALYRRLAAARYSLNLLLWRMNRLGPQEREYYKACFDMLAKEVYDTETILLADCPDMSPEAIEALVRQWQLKYGIQGVIIDYLGFVLSTGRTQEEEYAHAIRSLRAAARRTNIPFVILSQLNRQADEHMDEPRLSDIRGSGRIEQDCHTILFLHREKNILEPHRESPKGKIIVAKARDGATGAVNVMYRREFTRWEPVKADGPPAPYAWSEDHIYP